MSFSCNIDLRMASYAYRQVPQNGIGMNGRRFGAYLFNLFVVQPARGFDGFQGLNVFFCWSLEVRE